MGEDRFAVVVKGVGRGLGEGAGRLPGWSGRWGRYLRRGGRDVVPSQRWREIRTSAERVGAIP